MTGLSCGILSPRLYAAPPEGSEEQRRLRAKLSEAIREEHEKAGVTVFIVYMDALVGLWAVEEILKMKQAGENVTYEFVIPYETQSIDWPEGIRDRYYAAAEQCDREYLVEYRYSQRALRQARAYVYGADRVLMPGPIGDEPPLKRLREAGKPIRELFGA